MGKEQEHLNGMPWRRVAHVVHTEQQHIQCAALDCSANTKGNPNERINWGGRREANSMTTKNQNTDANQKLYTDENHLQSPSKFHIANVCRKPYYTHNNTKTLTSNEGEQTTPCVIEARDHKLRHQRVTSNRGRHDNESSNPTQAEMAKRTHNRSQCGNEFGKATQLVRGLHKLTHPTRAASSARNLSQHENEFSNPTQLVTVKHKLGHAKEATTIVSNLVAMRASHERTQHENESANCTPIVIASPNDTKNQMLLKQPLNVYDLIVDFLRTTKMPKATGTLEGRAYGLQLKHLLLFALALLMLLPVNSLCSANNNNSSRNGNRDAMVCCCFSTLAGVRASLTTAITTSQRNHTKSHNFRTTPNVRHNHRHATTGTATINNRKNFMNKQFDVVAVQQQSSPQGCEGANGERTQQQQNQKVNSILIQILIAIQMAMATGMAISGRQQITFKGICIIRLITFKRFIQIPQINIQQQQQSNALIKFHCTPQQQLHHFIAHLSSQILVALKRLCPSLCVPSLSSPINYVYSYYHYTPNNNAADGHVAGKQTPNGADRTSALWPRALLALVHRKIILLIVLSTLWHGSECFHGSVKLSANTVKTKYGLVRGIVVRSAPSEVEAYLGIPYASPPVGSLRFMPPITPSSWKNVRNADRFSAVCPQSIPIPPNGPEALLEVPRARLAQLRRFLPLLKNQSEDCLYLNIYVPHENRRHRRSTLGASGEHNASAKLATILFIHGESYEWNSGNPYDGSELAAHGNVIVVTINFRLGIFGFLKTGGKESAQGNFGLMDLVAGLHWLKGNLPAFGGDPQSITLFGHGTGAALANILVVSPVASDLVTRAMLVSGSALSPWAIQRNPLFVKRRVAEQTGCHGDMLYDDLAPCLRTKSVAELLAVKIDHPRFLIGFAPFVDGTVISPSTDSIGPISLPLGSAIVSTSGIEFANFPKRELIFCLTSVESYLDLSAQDLEFGFNETRRDRILRTFVRNNFHYHLNEIFAVLKNEYTDWEKAIRNPLSSRDATLSFLSDGHTASSLIKLGYMHSLRGGKSYFFHFKHRTVEEEFPQRSGSVRGEDVPFWLGLPVSPLFPHNYTAQERQISRLMLRYLTNFAKTGNPNQSSQSSPASMLASKMRQRRQKNTAEPSASSSANSKVKRSPLQRFQNLSNPAELEALHLAIVYNQRRSNAMHPTDRRSYTKRHLRSNDDAADSNEQGNANENGHFVGGDVMENDRLPFWDAYDVVNQLYLELGNKAEIQSHYRGHKLSMWLNLIPQLHKHSNINDQSMRHHQFVEDMNSRDLYEGVVRPQLQTKPVDDDDPPVVTQTAKPKVVNATQKATPVNNSSNALTTTTECGIDGVALTPDLTTQYPMDNHSLTDTRDLATASTGLIGNLEVLRRLSGKQFQSYTTALVATVAVGCFLLLLNILIFAGIYHQREKRARDAKTKEELQDTSSKNSSILKLNASGMDSLGGSFVSGKSTVLFGEYNCYDEKTKQCKDDKLLVDMPPVPLMPMDPNWAGCSTSTLDLLKTKHAPNALDAATFNLTTGHMGGPGGQVELSDMNLHVMGGNMEMVTYNPLEPTNMLMHSRRSSYVAAPVNQFDYAVQSSDQMCFKEIEEAVKAAAANDVDLSGHVDDDDIPEPPPPPKSFQPQAHGILRTTGTSSTAGGGSGPGGSGSAGGSATGGGGGKKRVHIQEISV